MEAYLYICIRPPLTSTVQLVQAIKARCDSKKLEPDVPKLNPNAAPRTGKAHVDFRV